MGKFYLPLYPLHSKGFRSKLHLVARTLYLGQVRVLIDFLLDYYEIVNKSNRESDMSEEKKVDMLSQITVAVVVALAVGSSAPGWWGMLFSDRESSEEVRPTGSRKPQETDSPAADFSGGSSRVYSADFSRWPTKDSEHGSVTLGFGNSYVLQPSSNTWIGPGRSLDIIPALDGDFVFDVRFRIEERNPSSSLQFGIRGGGNDAESVDVIFTVWRGDNVTYSLTKGRVRSGDGLSVPHYITEERIAEREQLPLVIKNHDWSKGSTLTLKREGGGIQFFVNGTFVKEFSVSRFPAMKTSVGAAFKSKVVITSIEARTRN